MEKNSEAELVQRSRLGDSESFGELVRIYQTSVFNVCYRLVGERREAEDLAQEAFIRAYQRFRSFDPSRPFGPWIRRVAANLAINRLQIKQVDSVLLDEECTTSGGFLEGDPQSMLEQSEASDGLAAAIRSLPPNYRIVIELNHFQEMSYIEMAEFLKIPLNDVKSRLFRARKSLLERLKTYG
ncbi:MAG: sigma-70 family RNA polymerase sigma factor [Anaerolineaceae bacterium]|nr:sigma-70 family RNA polymerase sigma factor [Anaerolineaceae bacterium]